VKSLTGSLMVSIVFEVNYNGSCYLARSNLQGGN